MKKSYKKAITLAEALITLTIIGIIVVLTIPVLQLDFSMGSRISMLKKLYTSYELNIESMLAGRTDFGAAQHAIVNNRAAAQGIDTGDDFSISAVVCDTLSCTRAWGKTDTNNNRLDINGNVIQQGEHNGLFADTNYFNVEAACSDCFTAADLPFVNNQNMSYSAYLLKDSSTVAIFDYTGNCNQGGIVANTCTDANGGNIPNCNNAPTVCSIIVLDVNGYSGPNKPGADRFAYYVSDEKIEGSFLVPFGYSPADAGEGSFYNVNGNLSSMYNNNSGNLAGYNRTAQIMINGWKGN